MQKDGSKEVRRGDIFWVKLDPTIGSETNKTRPAVVISNDTQNQYANEIVIIPLTSNINKVRSYQLLLTIDNQQSKALCNQIRTIDKSRLGNYIQKITPKQMVDLEKALKIVLDLE